MRELETARGELSLKAFAVRRGIPGVQGGGSDVVERDPGAGFHQPFARRGFRDRGVAFQDAGGQEPGAHVGAAFALGAVIASAGERRRSRRQAHLEGDQVANESAPGVVVVEVREDAVVADDAVDPVLVMSAVLGVLGPDVRLALQLELGLEGLPEAIKDLLRIDGLWRRVDVDVIDRFLRPMVGRAGDELAELRVQVALGDDAARLDHTGDLVGLGFE